MPESIAKEETLEHLDAHFEEVTEEEFVATFKQANPHRFDEAGRPIPIEQSEREKHAELLKQKQAACGYFS